ncbi:MAG: glycosyltransferase family 4 protein [Ktedonobacteraceae bacterium]
MRVLMISPQPYFESRGAPFCVHQHIKALVALGYQVDLVTYPIGKDIDLPGLTIYRAPAIPFIHNVKPGPSLAKFPLDLSVFLTALWRLLWRRYRYIHTHEEAGVMGVILSKMFGGKHLYYMHSDLSTVVASSDFTKSPLLLWIVGVVQKFMLRNADGVVAFYPGIAETAEKIAPGKPVYMILPPAVDEDVPAAIPDEVMQLRNQLKINDGPVLLYTGTLESYQGIDILLESVGAVRAEFPTARYIIAGGRPDQVEKLQLLSKRLNISDIVHFVGQRPLEEMPKYMALADILLSPRSKGTHTPLKLYTYLRSGVPMLATDILAHTQILTSAVALLVPPTAQGLAEGTLKLLRHPELASQLGESARQSWQEHYSWPAFLKKNRESYDDFAGIEEHDHLSSVM